MMFTPDSAEQFAVLLQQQQSALLCLTRELTLLRDSLIAERESVKFLFEAVAALERGESLPPNPYSLVSIN